MLTQHQLDIIKKIVFSQINANEYHVFIFGSRATGTAETYSDIDLGIEGSPLSARTKIELEEAFEASDLPFTVDIVDFTTTSEKFNQVAKQQMIAL